MITWQSAEIIRLVTEKYPEWDGFTHPEFVADEIDYKRNGVAKTRELIGRKAFKELLEAGRYDEIISRLEKVGRLTNLMYIAQPRNGDLAILYADGLNKWAFCQQVYALLYDDRPSPERLDSFVDYCLRNNLPARWPFATYLLFMTSPSADVFVKPRVAKWFMQFMGFGEVYVSELSADMYERYKKSWHGLKGELATFSDYPAKDMLDIQSLIWVAYDVSQKRVEGLDVKGQIELDRPTALREPEPVYKVNRLTQVGFMPSEIANNDMVFNENSFRLLDGITNNPTRKFYIENKAHFQEFIETPFKNLVLEIGRQLPPSISTVMEIEKRLFSRFLKNDFGRGGAWPFFWGAFYPKQRKRIESAQLSMIINHELLEFGFYIGEHRSEENERFLQNIRSYSNEVETLLADVFLDQNILWGLRDHFVVTDSEIKNKHGIDGKYWLENLETLGLDISVAVSRQRLLQLDEATLVEMALDVYIRLFPFVILTISDNPIPEIKKYLQLDIDKIGETSAEQKLQSFETHINPGYTLEECSAETGFELSQLQTWTDGVERRKQALFYGPPGTGKTYLAKHLAKHLIGGTDGFVETIQFHPAYDYADFMEGIRPQTQANGAMTWENRPGVFLNFCRQAENHDGPCVLIIDEINRGNLARIFGELMLLLEYRNESITLASGEKFSIPVNVRLIGTMNTADRSIALLDHALRRRFACIQLAPDLSLIEKYHAKHQTGFDTTKLIELLKQLNGDIADPAYALGVSYFLTPSLPADLPHIWQMEIEPYLEEYFFNQPDQMKRYRWSYVGSQISY